MRLNQSTHRNEGGGWDTPDVSRVLLRTLLHHHRAQLDQLADPSGDGSLAALASGSLLALSSHSSTCLRLVSDSFLPPYMLAFGCGVQATCTCRRWRRVEQGGRANQHSCQRDPDAVRDNHGEIWLHADGMGCLDGAHTSIALRQISAPFSLVLLLA